MYTISSNITDTKEINKSKFITYLYKIDNIKDIDNKLNEIKKEYKDATHICYAYIIDGLEKAYDDGEPSGTAGKPILDILKKHNLDHILAIVVRYFGGIKLGAGGLLRAYANSVNDIIKNMELKELVEAYKIRFEIPYDKVNLLPKENINVLYKEYDLNIIYEVITSKENIETIKNLVSKIDILEKIKTSF